MNLTFKMGRDIHMVTDYLFDQDKLHTFELTLSDQNLAYLDSAPALEEYVPGL